MTIEQLLNKGADTLRKAGVSEYRLDAWYLLSYYMNIGKNEYSVSYTHLTLPTKLEV